jgi:putative ABC transport system permease protein
MRSISAWGRFLVSRIDRRQLDRNMDDEMALHIQLHAEALERAGVPAVEARRRAVAEFGGVQRYREESRDARVFAWLHDLVADLRYGLRALRRSPGFTVVSVASLGLGIGANVAIFGLLYGLLLQPLAIPRARQLSALVVSYKSTRYGALLHGSYLALRSVPGAPELIAEYEADNVLVETPETRSFSRVTFVDGGYFSLLGVRPELGRVLTRQEEEGQEPVVVISDNLWSDLFARDENVVGKQLRLRGYTFTVVGVMPQSFRGVRFNAWFNMAVPAGFATLLGTPAARNYVSVLTRLDTPAQRAAFSVPIDAAFKRCCLTAERLTSDVRLSFVDASSGVPYGKTDFRDDYRLVLWSLMGGVLLVLLVACSNVGNLLLARATTRQRELSIRLSIGASRWRIVRQLLAESAIIAAAGAVLGFLLAGLTTRLLIAGLASVLSTSTALVEFGAKPALLLFTAAVAVTSVLAFGVGPALRATRDDPATVLRDRSESRSRRGAITDRLLVVFQVAIALVLVCGAGLLVTTLRNLRAVDPGFMSTHVAALAIETRGTAYEAAGIVPLHRDILDRARGVQGIVSAAMATRIPDFGGRSVSFPYTIVGESRLDSAEVWLTVITPGYLATARTALLDGRDFTDADRPGSEPVALASEAFVKRNFPARSPVGALVRIDRPDARETVRIVGVVRDVRFGDRREKPEPMLYLPAPQAGKWPFFLLLVRTGPEPQLVLPRLVRALAPYAARLQVSNPQMMNAATDAVLLRERLGAALASSCAILALVLAMVGLAGIVGFTVAQRTREIGVRMALGANRVGVVWLVLRGAVTLTVLGVVVGGPLALGAGEALQSLLYGIAPTDLYLLGGAALTMVSVALIAAAAPAFRASRVDPVIALRAE